VYGNAATSYTVAVSATGQVEPTYAWKLTPPADEPDCDEFGPVPGEPERAVWRHSAADGCTRAGSDHDGTVTVVVTTDAWECTASFTGSGTATGPPVERCRTL
jgi:hypothetical protein